LENGPCHAAVTRLWQGRTSGHARQVKGVVIKTHRVLVNRAKETTETLIATDTTEKNFMIISVASVVLSAFSGKNRHAKS
jgi:hypothetical protein